MTYQEILWCDRRVMVTSIFAKSGKPHRKVRNYLGRYGMVVRETKGGQLLVQFARGHQRGIPAGCLSLADNIDKNWVE